MTDATPRFHRELTRHELAKRELTVSRVERVAPEMIRVTLTGDDLAGFPETGPADHIKLFLPDPETGIIHSRRPGEEPSGPIFMRDFTPVPRANSLDLDFYTHADPGPAATWAENAKVGDVVQVAGPRGSRGIPQGAERFVLIADETALPSISRWWTLIPRSVSINVIAMVGDDGAWVPDYIVEAAAGYDEAAIDNARAARTPGVRIVGRSADEALAALAELTIDETTFVWAAGEATELIPIRRHLRRELGLSKDQAVVDGYWRRGAADFDHHAPLDPTDPED